MKRKLLIFWATVCLILISGFFLTSRPKKITPALPTWPQFSKSLFRDFFKNPTPIPAPVVLIATGDVMLGRAINYKSVRENNFTWMFEKTADTLRVTDIVFINLESPLINNCPLATGGMIFCADPKNIAGLIFAGVDVANLANNHISNYGQEGINNTISLLENAGILATGVSGPVYKEINQIKLAFLGYNQFGHLPDIGQEIKKAKDQANLVVVSFHWGEEYTDKPTRKQQELARLAIDSGADLVIGHHPHWVQPIEVYQDKLIVYSLGNFIFDQGWSEKTRLGEVGQFTFTISGLVDYRLLPVKINPSGQPEIL